LKGDPNFDPVPLGFARPIGGGFSFPPVPGFAGPFGGGFSFPLVFLVFLVFLGGSVGPLPNPLNLPLCFEYAIISLFIYLFILYLYV
jgi:hypothetical protein